MDEFSYLSVLLSIILGLSVTQLLKGLGGLIQYRDRVKIYGPAVTWALLLILINAQAWWAMFGLRVHHPWTFLEFIIVLLETIFLYLLAALVLPRFDDQSVVDLKENYFGHSQWFFGSFAAVLVVSMLKDRILQGFWPGGLNLLFHLVALFGSGLAMTTKSDRFHRGYAFISAFILFAYIALLFSQLR